MKIIVNRTEVFDFDYDKEIEREQLQRQLDFINTALIEKDSEKALEIYDNMPYDEENECPEQEYTGLWTGINASSKCNKMKYTERLDRVFQIQKRRIIKFLPIRDRIKFIHDDFNSLQNIEATWFVDPPYQIISKNGSIFQNGDGYSKTCNSASLNFGELADFCLERRGQLIVCEKEGADWLPFTEFRKNKTSLNKNYNEVVYIK